MNEQPQYRVWRAIAACRHGSRVGRVLIVMGLHALSIGACTDVVNPAADFDRHRYSRLVVPADRPGTVWFDVMFPPAYPADDPVAEATRQRWLSEWLTQRRLCPAGHAVMARRAFLYLEDNPGGYRQRQEVRCAAAGAGPGGR